MKQLNQTIIGVFAERADGEKVVSELEKLGYSPKDISVMVKDQKVGDEVTRSKGTNVTGGMTAGAATGTAVGALTGLLVSIGAVTVPGIGALFIGGPIITALGLTGAAATTVSAATSGLLAGGLVGSLIGLGLPEEVAHVYETRLKEGAVVIAVPVVSNIDKVKAHRIYEDNSVDQLRTISAD